MRFQRAAFGSEFAFFGAIVTSIGQEAGIATASQLDVPDQLRMRGIGGARSKSKIESQLLQLLNGHIQLL
jgi:hypothetical protein